MHWTLNHRLCCSIDDLLLAAVSASGNVASDARQRGSMPRTSKTVRPAVLAMQKKSMEVILRRVGAAADQAASPRASAPIVLRDRLRVGLPSPSAEDRQAELPATDGRSDVSG